MCAAEGSPEDTLHAPPVDSAHRTVPLQSAFVPLVVASMAGQQPPTQPTPEMLETREGERARTLLLLAAALAGSPGARVPIAAIATDRERFVGGVHFQLAETSEDGDDKRIDDVFHELSSLFPAAVPPEVSADDFEEADCSVQAVASLADEDIVAAVAGTQDAQADSSSGDEDRLDEAAATRAYSAAEVVAAFASIHRFCGDME
ncbi:hypothetical protein HPB52_001349 [Rhipicephalus sanguineus]|uniref:Uncharacterized protein n=1 Tax=Rhipicephalus sanguineus TaxID=34632 RepID=A0A9D4QCE2_RHISA|nr:hypothetical protein HPB52_001349 [Rhipicephalus sanguineus]